MLALFIFNAVIAVEDGSCAGNGLPSPQREQEKVFQFGTSQNHTPNPRLTAEQFLAVGPAAICTRMVCIIEYTKAMELRLPQLILLSLISTLNAGAAPASAFAEDNDGLTGGSKVCGEVKPDLKKGANQPQIEEKLKSESGDHATPSSPPENCCNNSKNALTCMACNVIGETSAKEDDDSSVAINQTVLTRLSSKKMG